MAAARRTRGGTLLGASDQRLADSETLFRGRRYHGCIYMAGYAVECALKAAICRRRGELSLDDNDRRHIDEPQALDHLLERADLLRARDRDPAIRRDFELILKRWTHQMRYSDAAKKPADAEAALRTTRRLMDWLRRM